MIAIVVADAATCRAFRQTVARARNPSRVVTATRSHGCELLADGVRRPASRIRSRSPGSIGRSLKLRTFRRALMASHVSMAHLRLGVTSSGLHPFRPARFALSREDGETLALRCRGGAGGSDVPAERRPRRPERTGRT